MMLEIKNTTLVGIISSHDYWAQTSRALDYSRSMAKFPKVKLLEVDIDHRLYSQWLLANLHKEVDTDYCLVIQWDSGIINPELWTDDFFNYDYIGALWPEFYGLSNRIGNGGFSLRSQKFMEECSKIAAQLPVGQFLLGNEDLYACHTAYNYMVSQGVRFADVITARKFSVERQSNIHDFDPEDISTYKSFGFHGDFNLGGMKKVLGL